ncbi:MAG: UDP-N-acetylglucosamine 2-epimerase (non-hydrolyzing) [Pirellulaceae bacterium]|jgi:UDP-N-acetylglucosamine 2-epimerase (non-hydrolysing)
MTETLRLQNTDVTRPLLVVGTRPEAIKMAPVIQACQSNSSIDPVVCFTGQHREMLAQVADYFEISPDIDLEVMRPNQSLSGLTCRCLEGLDRVIHQYSPTCVVAQGDTTTVLTASMSSFYHKLPFVHVEAGLRTGDIYSPWPEEYNRRVAGLSTAVHCAPTLRASQNLIREGVPQSQIEVTGNTVIDALLWTVDRERQNDAQWRAKNSAFAAQPMVLITGHRRENFGPKFESICRAIRRLAVKHSDHQFVYPVHLNPQVREPVYRLLGERKNIHLVEPASYPEFVWLMDNAKIILTDSGGVQEEAPSLRKPVLVLRDSTERPEAVEHGAVKLVGTDEDTIVESASELLSNAETYRRHQLDTNPYGDGKAAARIAGLIARQAWLIEEATPMRRAA